MKSDKLRGSRRYFAAGNGSVWLSPSRPKYTALRPPKYTQ
jgi:hypothetical protein